MMTPSAMETIRLATKICRVSAPGRWRECQRTDYDSRRHTVAHGGGIVLFVDVVVGLGAFVGEHHGLAALLNVKIDDFEGVFVNLIPLHAPEAASTCEERSLSLMRASA